MGFKSAFKGIKSLNLKVFKIVKVNCGYAATSPQLTFTILKTFKFSDFIPLNADLNPICHLLALLGAHHILHVSRIRVNINLPFLFVHMLVYNDKHKLINLHGMYIKILIKQYWGHSFCCCVMEVVCFLSCCNSESVDISR
jgi:hypothetical protein